MARKKSIIEWAFGSSVVSIILAAVAVLLGVVIDGIVIGRFLGPDKMAAFTLVTPIVSIVTVFGSIFSTGVQVICAQRIGEGNIKGARQAFSICMIATAVISILLTASVIIFRNDIAVLLGATGDSAVLLPDASDYLLGLALAGPSSIFLFEFNSLMRLDGGAMRVTVAVAVMTVLDIIGDLVNVLFIHGGMLGMGLTTTISYLVAFIIMGIHFLKKDIIFRFSLKGMKLKDLRDILVIGAPSAVGSASTGLRTIVHNHIMVGTLLSVTAVGAFGVINTVFNFTSCVLIGVGITTSMIAGMILGEQDRRSAKQLIRTAVKTALVIGTSMCVLIFIFAYPLASLFGNEEGEEMVELAARGLRFFSVSLILYGINSTFTNYLQGIRRMTYSLIFSFLHTFVFMSAAAIALANSLQTDAVWLSFVIGEALTLISFLILAAVLKRGVPHPWEDLLFLREPFGAPDEDVLDITITSAGDVAPAAAKVKEFCAGRGADERRTKLLATFTETIGNYVTSSCFDGNETRLMEIRLVARDGRWTMRCRDNCRACDPVAAGKITDVCDNAAMVEYVNSLSLNILTVEV